MQSRVQTAEPKTALRFVLLFIVAVVAGNFASSAHAAEAKIVHSGTENEAVIWQPSAATTGGVRFGKDLSKQRRSPTARTPVLRGTDTRLGVAEMPSSANGPSVAPGENTGGAIGDGVSDDHAALQSVLDTGQTVVLGAGKTYRITKQLVIRSNNTGIRGDGTATILMGSGPGEFDQSFNSQLFPQYRYAPNSVGIAATGLTGPFVDNVIIRYEGGSDDRYVRAIAFRRCYDVRITNNDISNFSKSLGIVYLGAITGGIVSGNEIHSSHTNSSTIGQITGIEFDNDDDGSMLVDVTRNYIHDLTVGPDFLRQFNYQTDGINVTMRSNNILVSENRIENVGEGIDSFGTKISISRNNISQAYLFGIKLIHGASASTISENIISNAGLAGIVLSGSSSVPRDTADNLVINNQINGINMQGVHPRFTYGIAINYKQTIGKVRRNKIRNNIVDLGSRGAVGIAARPETGSDNEVDGNTIRAWARRPYLIDRRVVPYFRK